MKFLYLVVGLVFGCLSLEASGGSHLFILSGQSNMARLDPSNSFIPTLESNLGTEKFIVVKDAIGGQPIRRWYKKWKSSQGEKSEMIGDLYDQLMVKVREAIAGQVVETVSFIWMQGERDAREGNGYVYEESFLGLLEQLKQDLDIANMNVVIGRLSDFDMDNKKYPHWTFVRNVQVSMAEKHPRFSWVDTDDLNEGLNAKGESISNDLHYSVEGYKEFGKRLGMAALKLIHEND